MSCTQFLYPHRFPPNILDLPCLQRGRKRVVFNLLENCQRFHNSASFSAFSSTLHLHTANRQRSGMKKAKSEQKKSCHLRNLPVNLYCNARKKESQKYSLLTYHFSLHSVYYIVLCFHVALLCYLTCWLAYCCREYKSKQGILTHYTTGTFIGKIGRNS